MRVPTRTNTKGNMVGSTNLKYGNWSARPACLYYYIFNYTEQELLETETTVRCIHFFSIRDERFERFLFRLFSVVNAHFILRSIRGATHSLAHNFDCAPFLMESDYAKCNA